VRCVSYYRVSTAKQGRSGLGLDAQQAAVRDYLRRHDGGSIADYVEVESGKKNDRPQLAAAMTLAGGPGRRW
jgi:DNA invertase Pin-like site-specific DNA recombinase